MNRAPRVSIITPSLNMAESIDETIRSVLDQDYPGIEYLVMDGGSTDGTLEILAGYGDVLRYVSAPDGGQADAINRGFAATTGEILGFLNADDTYLPGAVDAAVQTLIDHPDVAVVYGDALYTSADGRSLGPYPVEPDAQHTLARRCAICQPASFFRRDAFVAVGGLDPTLRFALDYDLWIRMARRFRFAKIDRTLATLRLHDDAKTINEMEQAIGETVAMLRKQFGYVPYNWIYGATHHRRTGQSIAHQRPSASVASACYSLALGSRLNWRHPIRFCIDVIATMARGFS